MQNIGYRASGISNDGGEARAKVKRDIARFVTLSAICVILSVFPPVTVAGLELTALVSWPIALISGAVLVYSSKSFSSIFLLSFLCIFTSTYTGSPVLFAFIMSMIAVCGAYSALVAEASKAVAVSTVLLAPVISSALAYILTGDIFAPLISLIPYIPAAAMGTVSRRRMGRAAEISAFAFASAIVLSFFVMMHIYDQNGGLSPELVRSSADYLQTQIIHVLKDAVISAGNVPLNEEIITEIELISAEMINCLPGLVISLLLTVGFFVQKLQQSFFGKFELEGLQNKSGEQICASTVSALIFIIAHICSFTSGASGDGSLFSVAAMNIYLILLPLMLAVGGGFLLSLPQRMGFLAVVIWIVAVFASVLLSASVISVIALVGSFRTIIISVDSWAKEHYSKGEDQ